MKWGPQLPSHPWNHTLGAGSTIFWDVQNSSRSRQLSRPPDPEWSALLKLNKTTDILVGMMSMWLAMPWTPVLCAFLDRLALWPLWYTRGNGRANGVILLLVDKRGTGYSTVTVCSGAVSSTGATAPLP